MFDRLLSPNGRRIAEKEQLGRHGTATLLALGWTDYQGTAQTTEGNPPLAGWVIPGTDQHVDVHRRTRTGSTRLGDNTGTKDNRLPTRDNT